MYLELNPEFNQTGFERSDRINMGTGLQYTSHIFLQEIVVSASLYPLEFSEEHIYIEMYHVLYYKVRGKQSRLMANGNW